MSAKYYWVTKDGDKVNVDDMDVHHLRAVLKMILRNRRELAKVRAKSKIHRDREVVLNGEMAQAFNDTQEEDFLDDMPCADGDPEFYKY